MSGQAENLLFSELINDQIFDVDECDRSGCLATILSCEKGISGKIKKGHRTWYESDDEGIEHSFGEEEQACESDEPGTVVAHHGRRSHQRRRPPPLPFDGRLAHLAYLLFIYFLFIVFLILFIYFLYIVFSFRPNLIQSI